MKRKIKERLGRFSNGKAFSLFIAINKTYYFEYAILNEENLPYILTKIKPVITDHYYWSIPHYQYLEHHLIVELSDFLLAIPEKDIAVIAKGRSKINDKKFGNTKGFLETKDK